MKVCEMCGAQNDDVFTKCSVYKIKKMEFKEEYVNEISRFSNRL